MRFAKTQDDFTQEVVRCRGLGHMWKPYTADSVSEKSFKGYNVTLICDTCRTMKHFMLSMRGEYYPATYTYCDEYLLAKGQPHLTKADKGHFKLDALSEILPATEPATVTHITKGKRRA